MPTILITGGSGRIGSVLRQRLARPGRILRLLDITPPASPGPGEEVVVASVTDMAAMTKACAGADAVIHLGGVSGEGPWDKIIGINIQGTYTVFEAARRAAVPRVIFASSNHAVGFTPRSAFPVPDYAFPAPDTYYGVSKVTGEALASCTTTATAWTRSACASCPASSGRRHALLSTWLSPDDAGRLFEACLTVERPVSGWPSASQTTPAAAGSAWTRHGPWATRRVTTRRTMRAGHRPARGTSQTIRCSPTWAALVLPAPTMTRKHLT